jgi:hypothetical protein
MRFVVALGLFIAMCASAEAATVHHSNPRHHASVRHAYGVVPPFAVRPSQAEIPSYVTPNGVRIYRDDSVPGGLRTDHDPPPGYDDPSKFGGA